MLIDTHQALLNAIRENPDDEAPRLILADWLEEHGDSERAAFIRLAIEVARLGEEDDNDPRRDEYVKMWQTYGKAWNFGLPKQLLDSGHLNRGFWCSWRTDGKTFLRHIDKIWQREPISYVSFNGPVAAFATVVHDPRIGGLREIRLSELEGEQAIALNAICVSPYLEQLRRLHLVIGGGSVLPRETADLLRRWRLPHLQELTLAHRDYERRHQCYLAAASAILEGTLLRDVRALNIHSDYPKSGLADSFAQAPTQNVQQLMVTIPPKHDRWLEVLAQSARLKKLRVLRLRCDDHPAPVWEAFFASRLAEQLTALHLPALHFPTKIYDALAKTANLRRLRELNLGGTRSLNDRALQRIGKNHRLMNSLRVLNLSATEVTPAGTIVQELRAQYPKCRIEL